DVEGEGQVCAGDIKPSADFEIVNPELYLASLDSHEAKLSVEFNVEVDKGYRPAKHNDGLPIGVIPVDAIFTPVRKVNFRVEPSHIVQETSCERLTLEVWTDGSISAVEAVSRSADILVEHFSLLTDLVKVSERTAEKEALRLAIPAEQYDMPVEQMGLSVRTLNCLRRGEITTVGQLLEKSPQELMALRSFGQKSLDEINERLQAMGLAIPGEVGVAGEEAGEEDNVDEGD
ncbi:MAG: DNA-directed RNA polymerase subunit alpha C-terminal domain-containing protein, partial [Dehalococcoidia bacterium]